MLRLEVALLVRIKILNLGITIDVPIGLNLGEALRRAGILALPCGGKGLCKLCRVKVVRGDIEVREDGVLGDSYVLACRARVLGDLEIEVPTYTLEFSDQRVVDPYIHDIADPRTWLDKLLALSNTVIESEPLSDFEYVAIVDLGTTKICTTVYDLDGRRLHSKLVLNPLIRYGLSIIDRLELYVRDMDTRYKMVYELRSKIKELLPTGNRVLIVVAGNSVNQGMLLDQPLDKLARYPFEPPHVRKWIVTSIHCDSLNKNNVTVVFPCIGGFVGGDLVADLVYCEYIGIEKPYMVIDLGTNSEIAIVSNDTIVATSAPAGPAIEGIGIGSSYAEAVTIRNIKSIDVRTNYVEVVVELCGERFAGSDLVKLFAKLVEEGVIDRSGKLRNDHLVVEVYDVDGRRCTSMRLTKRDIRSFQLAKAAIEASWRYLIKSMSIRLDDLKTVVVVGAFGSGLDVESAIAIGLLPPLHDRTIVLGNTVIAGGKVVSMYRLGFELAQHIVERSRHISLTSSTFSKLWLDSLRLEVAS